MARPEKEAVVNEVYEKLTKSQVGSLSRFSGINRTGRRNYGRNYGKPVSN